MKLAIVGCGYAADYYVKAIACYPSLTVVGVHDRDAERQRAFTTYHQLNGYPSLDSLLGDPEVELVVNVTSPGSHVVVSEAALLAGKHVYSEKPLALAMADATRLRELADSLGLLLVSAPCNLLSEAVQTAWQEIRSGRIGRPRLAYAELDSGPITRMSPEKWQSLSGARFPFGDELSLGWTVAHAAYALSLLTAFFGPAELVVSQSLSLPAARAYASAEPPDRTADISLAAITHEDGVVARLTSSMVAPLDQSLRFVGDEGMISVRHSGAFSSPVTFSDGLGSEPCPIPLLAGRHAVLRDPDCNDYDFAAGIYDLARAAAGEDALHLATDHAVHVLELSLAIADATAGSITKPETSFAPVAPVL